jgi:hypothetical protein
VEGFCVHGERTGRAVHEFLEHCIVGGEGGWETLMRLFWDEGGGVECWSIEGTHRVVIRVVVVVRTRSTAENFLDDGDKSIHYLKGGSGGGISRM